MFTDVIQAVVNQSSSEAGFGDVTNNHLLLGNANDAFDSYDLKSPIGPTSGLFSTNGVPFGTSAGDLTLMDSLERDVHGDEPCHRPPCSPSRPVGRCSYRGRRPDRLRSTPRHVPPSKTGSLALVRCRVTDRPGPQIHGGRLSDASLSRRAKIK